MKRNAVFYVVLLIVAGLGIAALLHTGMKLPAPVGEINPAHVKPAPAESASLLGSMGTTLGMNFHHLGGWSICLLIILVATAGKLGGSALTAKFSGMNWRDSLQLGALMNTRGLMELIALNIGYDLGILSPRIFTMLVIMALVTTALTGPLLTLFGKVPVGAREDDKVRA